MLKAFHVAAIVAATTLTSSAAFAAAGAPGHSHATFSAGEPGNPKKKSRVIVVKMNEGDGKMMFIPNRLEIKRGEQIKFVLENVGELEHEFVLATAKENIEHAKEMQKNPDMEHADPNATRVKPKKKGEIVWRFSKRGTFEYGCLIPGHRETGMIGTIVVK